MERNRRKKESLVSSKLIPHSRFVSKSVKSFSSDSFYSSSSFLQSPEMLLTDSRREEERIPWAHSLNSQSKSSFHYGRKARVEERKESFLSNNDSAEKRRCQEEMPVWKGRRGPPYLLLSIWAIADWHWHSIWLNSIIDLTWVRSRSSSSGVGRKNSQFSGWFGKFYDCCINIRCFY